MTETAKAPTAGSGEWASDEQVIGWAVASAEDDDEDALLIAVTSLHDIHARFSDAKQSIGERLAAAGQHHLIESVEVWPYTGTDEQLAGIFVTVDLPEGTTVPAVDGIRLCTLSLDGSQLAAAAYSSTAELYEDLLTSVFSFARDLIDAHRRALHGDELAAAAAAVRATITGSNGDAEHDAAARLATLAETILEGGQL